MLRFHPPTMYVIIARDDVILMLCNHHTFRQLLIPFMCCLREMMYDEHSLHSRCSLLCVLATVPGSMATQYPEKKYFLYTIVLMSVLTGAEVFLFVF